MFPVDLLGQLALMGMNTFEAEKAFSKQGAFPERKEFIA
jgi:hypothetical protein